MLPDIGIHEGESKQQYTERVRKEMSELDDNRRKRLESGATEVTMDVDDFGFLLPGFDDLKRLKESLPGLKITCFTIPFDAAFFNTANAKHFKWDSYRKWAAIVNEHDWIDVAFHGFSHVPHECDTSYDKGITILTAAEKLFEKVGLRYIKLFKAPYWQMSYDFLMALRDRGYTVAIDRNHMRPVPKGLRSYVYNWSFEEALPYREPIKGHGHFTGNNRNNISDTMHNICRQLPVNTKFIRLADYLSTNDDTPQIMRQFRQ